MTKKSIKKWEVHSLNSTDDYRKWKYDMTANFRIQEPNIWKVIRGDYASKESGLGSGIANAPPDQLEDIETANTQAVGMIMLTLGPNMRQHVDMNDDAHTMWCKLTKAFENKAAFRAEKLENDLNTLTMKDNESIDAYATRIGDLAEELSGAGVDVDVKRKLKVLLRGLTGEYAIWKTIMQREADNFEFNSHKDIKIVSPDGTKFTTTISMSKVTEQEYYESALATLRAKEEIIKQTDEKGGSRHSALASNHQQSKPSGNRFNLQAASPSNNNSLPARPTGQNPAGGQQRDGQSRHLTAAGPRTPVTCYYCLLGGHIARECPQKTNDIAHGLATPQTRTRHQAHLAFQALSQTFSGFAPAAPQPYMAMAPPAPYTPQPNPPRGPATHSLHHVQHHPPTPQPSDHNINIVEEHYAGLSHVGAASTDGRWMLDSGATAHMCYDAASFHTLKYGDFGTVEVGSKARHPIKGKGTIIIYPRDSNHDEIILHDTLFVPAFAYNLCSVEALGSGNTTTFTDHQAIVRDRSGNRVLGATTDGNLYYIDVAASPFTSTGGTALWSRHRPGDLTTWHHRLAHVNYRSIRDTADITNNMTLTGGNDRPPCSHCHAGKDTRQPHPPSDSRTTRPLELVHSDISGPHDPTVDGFRYMATFTDDYSRYCSILLINKKSDLFDIMVSTIARLENLTGHRVAQFCSDNGGEYVNNRAEHFFTTRGIVHERTTPYTAQQNGVAERMNKTIFDLVRSMMHQSGTPSILWGDAAMYAAYVRNRVANSHNPRATPYELFFGRKPDMSLVHPFGCQAWLHIPAERRTSKHAPRAIEMLFVGVAADRKAYTLFDTASGRLFTSYDVAFEEKCFPLRALQDDKSNEPSVPPHPVMPISSIINMRAVAFAFAVIATAPLLEPLTLKEARNRPDWQMWKEAVDKELASHAENVTWEEVGSVDPAQRVVSCKWVFKLKLLPDGSIDKYKARLVARGFTQQHGIDYDETFAPVMKFATFRILIALAAAFSMFVHQMDVVTAFLNGTITEYILMQHPTDPGKAVRLLKALYGLKQAGRAWYEKIDAFLLNLGFKRTESDHSLYVLKTGVSSYLIVAIYVDDIVILCHLLRDFDWLRDQLTKTFKMTGGDELSYVLGLEVEHHPEYIKVHQSAYTRRQVDKFLSKPANSQTPLPASEAVPTDDRPLSDGEHATYRQIVGSILYASTGTRPDIAYAISALSKELAAPTLHSMKRAQHLLQYMNFTHDAGLHFMRGRNTSGTAYLEAYSDADFAGDKEERKSTTGVVITINGTPVNWLSKKQSITADSTTFAEYIAMSEAAKDIIWTRQLLQELSFEQVSPTPLYIDNTAAQILASDPKNHARTKHIDIKYHFTREQVKLKRIAALEIGTAHQKADVLTKPLGPTKMETARHQLAMTGGTA